MLTQAASFGPSFPFPVRLLVTEVDRHNLMVAQMPQLPKETNAYPEYLS